MTPLVDVRGLVKEFAGRGGLFRSGTPVRAVDDVTFAIAPGETFGLVGESGSGKTTTGRCLLRLIEPTAGDIRIKDQDVRALSASDLRRARRHFQIVFQDPYSSLNPRMRVGAIVEEPLVIHKLGNSAERKARVASLLELVGLDPSDRTKYPHEFSGGQRQRAGQADALALAAAELVRVFRHRRRIETDQLEEVPDARTLSVPRSDLVDLERLPDDGADAHAGVERRIRILKDDLEVTASLPELAG